jgi:hypothetical protein
MKITYKNVIKNNFMNKNILYEIKSNLIKIFNLKK